MPKASNSITDIIEIIDPNLRAGFAQVPRLVLRAKGLSNTAKLVYALLLDYAWQKGSCFPGQHQLAEDLDTTERTIRRALDELKQYGLIAWKRRGMAQTNIYSILSLSDNPRFQPNRQDHEAYRTGMSSQYRIFLCGRIYPQKDTQENNNSKLREAQPQEQKPDELKQRRAEPFATQPTVSREAFERIQQQLHKPLEQDSSQTGSSLEQVPLAQQSGLNRHYLTAARTRTTRQANTDGMSSLASVLPKPEPKKRTYSQERQVLVDVISDLAREFRDEAKLTESASRANNLMGKAGISDVGVFVSKIYEARSITKECYGTIQRRMPYFFSVLTDVCGLKPKNATQNPPSE